MLLPSFGNQHHRGVRERVAAHRHQLGQVIERGRSGLSLTFDRIQLLQVVAEDGRFHHAFAARIRLKLLLTVCISLLCATVRHGGASGHSGNVLVENR
jgi:hypothetical protein